MRFVRRLFAFAGALLVVLCLVPVESFALDPVTDTVIINAWAQAVAAYGAAHGVSMGFDVSDSDQIGEGVHELWDQYVADVADPNVPTYDSAAVNWWANAYRKIGDSVGINIGSSDASALDGFWNWVLSGPAEMVKVDNQYQWPVDSATGTVQPVSVYNYSITSLNGREVGTIPASFHIGNSLINVTLDSGGPAYFALVKVKMSGTYYTCICMLAPAGSVLRYGWTVQSFNTNMPRYGNLYAGTGLYQGETDGRPLYVVPDNVSLRESDIPAWLFGDDHDQMLSDDGIGIDVGPYGDDGITIPDNEDVNYEPLPVGIGIDVPWIWGDGDTPLTEEQKHDIVEDVGDQIVEDGEIAVEEEEADNPDIPEEDEPIGEAGDYVVAGLEDVFPFCIPFDIYHFLSALAATPQAPSFTATLEFPEIIGGTKTIEIDFDTPTFNRLAQILRLMELLAFIVGLAFVTRSMFVRG